MPPPRQEHHRGRASYGRHSGFHRNRQSIRLGSSDLAGHLLEQGGWYHLDLPAIAVDDSVISVGPGKLVTRRRGEVLHPERESKAALDRIRAEIGSLMYSAQYHMASLRDLRAAVRATEKWIDDVMRRLGWHNREQVYLAMLTTLHAFRDCLPQDEAYCQLIDTQWPTDPTAKPTPWNAGLPDAINNKPGGNPTPVFVTNITMETYFQKGAQSACNQAAGRLDDRTYGLFRLHDLRRRGRAGSQCFSTIATTTVSRSLCGRLYPLMQMIGRKRATLRASPACSAAITTAPTSL